MNLEIIIPSDEPVRLLSAVAEELDYSRLTATYSRSERIEHSPRLLFKIVLYGCTRGIYATREIECACRENVNFMYLLEGHRAPDHNTIARFRRDHLPYAVEDLLNQMVRLLVRCGELSFEESAVFIDGTKIEANANRYSFVWKTAVTRRQARLGERIAEELPKLLEVSGTGITAPRTITVQRLKKNRKELYARKHALNTNFVRGKGHRKSGLQKAVETINEWLERLKRCNLDIHICGDRNSYSKTDPDATFMHMKEDHMKNGQLKPGYNVNVATVSEYIVGNYISADRTDTKTFIPFLKKLCSTYPVQRVVVDSGYESEENYSYVDGSEQLSLFVKPADHEQKKKRKYKTDIGRRENIAYDAEKDAYTCAQGRNLQAAAVKKRRSETGYVQEVCLRMRRLQRLPGKSAVHPSKEDGQNIAGRPRQAFECLQIFYPTAKSNGEKDFHSRRDPAPGQSFHSGGGRVCRNQGRSELPPISDPRKRQCHSGMVSCEHGV